MTSWNTDIVTCETKNAGLVAKVNKEFDLVKVKFWISCRGNGYMPFARISNNLKFPDGLMISTMSDGEYKLRKINIPYMKLPESDSFITMLFSFYNQEITKGYHKNNFATYINVDRYSRYIKPTLSSL